MAFERGGDLGDQGRVETGEVEETRELVTDTLPANAIFLNSSCASVLGNNPLVCAVAVPGNGVGSFNVSVQVPATATHGSAIANGVTNGSLTSTVTSTVRALADVGVSKLAKPDGAIATGGTVTVSSP